MRQKELESGRLVSKYEKRIELLGGLEDGMRKKIDVSLIEFV